jgi:hypothetical protein
MPGSTTSWKSGAGTEVSDRQHLWIDYGWRTHGKGDQDKGGRRTQTLLSEEVRLKIGEHREYPFRFRALNGPETYHGRILNVDWYVTAHLDIPRHRNIKTEQDFLLIASEAPNVICLGDIWRSKDQLPNRSRYERKMIPGHPDTRPANLARDLSAKIFSGVLGLLFVVIFSLDSLKYYILGFIGLLICLAIFLKIYSYASSVISKAICKCMFEIRDLQVMPSDLYPGDWVTCRLQFQTKRTMYLDRITATLAAEEVAVTDAGSDSITTTHTVYVQSFVKSYTENLVARRLIYFDHVLPIMPDAPVTFKSRNNEIQWSVKVKIIFKRWLSWEKAIPITVW